MKTEHCVVLVTAVGLLQAFAGLGCGVGDHTPASMGPGGVVMTPGGSGGSTMLPASGGSGGARAAMGPVAASGVGGSAGVGGPSRGGSGGTPGTGGVGGVAGGTGVGGLGGGIGGAMGRGTGGMGAAGTGGSGGAAGTGGAGSTGIWMPKPGTTWQWQLTGTIDTSIDVQMYDIDLFNTSTATIQGLHAAGRIVVCYFSAGSYEPGRPDSAALQQTGLGSVLDGWPDEKWLDIRSTAVRDIMKARLAMAKSKGCDGVEPDNVDGFDNSNGLGLTQQDQVSYNQFLATEGHAQGLSVGLKNSLGLVPTLVSSFDWALNEECLKYSECDALAPFISAGKAVFHCEYASSTSGICGKAPQGFSTIVKNLNLDAFRLACP